MAAMPRRGLTMLIGALLFLTLSLPTRAASPAFLVRDINTTNVVGSNPLSFTALNGTLFFVADDDSHGQELWKSDGTADGTLLVKDILPGAGPSSPIDLTILNGTLFFLVLNGPGGAADSTLWRSDGTLDGTRPVGAGYNRPSRLRSMNGRLFFVAYDPIHGQELWTSDGTDAGTALVKDIVPGQSDAFDFNQGQLGSYVSEIVVVNGVLFFSASGDNSGPELWKSDGTAGGTVRLKDIVPGVDSSLPLSLTDASGRLFFSANQPASGRELWISDGTATGTQQLADINPGPASSSPIKLTNASGRLFFSANQPASGRELWTSDGTPAGTQQLADIDPGPAGSLDYYDSFFQLYPEMVGVNGIVFFTANDGTGNYELWTSDGTAAGTHQLVDINPGLAPSLPINLRAVGGTLFFSADDGSSGYELWKSDGTAARTTRLVDVASGNVGSRPASFTIAGTHLFFSADDGSSGRELWAIPLNVWLDKSIYLPLMWR